MFKGELQQYFTRIFFNNSANTLSPRNKTHYQTQFKSNFVVHNACVELKRL
jgi:hypothetical protein